MHLLKLVVFESGTRRVPCGENVVVFTNFVGVYNICIGLCSSFYVKHLDFYLTHNLNCSHLSTFFLDDKKRSVCISPGCGGCLFGNFLIDLSSQ